MHLITNFWGKLCDAPISIFSLFYPFIYMSPASINLPCLYVSTICFSSFVYFIYVYSFKNLLVFFLNFVVFIRFLFLDETGVDFLIISKWLSFLVGMWMISIESGSGFFTRWHKIYVWLLSRSSFDHKFAENSFFQTFDSIMPSYCPLNFLKSLNSFSN